MAEKNIKWRKQLADSRDALESKIDKILHSLLKEVSKGAKLPPERSEAATQTEPEDSNMRLAISHSPAGATSDSGTLIDQQDEASRDVLQQLMQALPEGEEALRATIAVAHTLLIQQQSTIRSFEQSLVSLRDENSALLKRLETKEAENCKYQAAQETYEISKNRLMSDLQKAGREVEALRKSIGQFHSPASPLFQSVKDAVLRDMRGEKSASPHVLLHMLQLTEEPSERRPAKRPRTNSHDPVAPLVVDTDMASRSGHPTAPQSAPVIPGRPLDAQVQAIPPYSNPPSAQPLPRYTGLPPPVNPSSITQQQQTNRPQATTHKQGHRPSRSLSLDVPPNGQQQHAPYPQGLESPIFLYTLQSMPPTGGNDQATITAIPYGWMPSSTANPPRPIVPTQRSHPPAPGSHPTNGFSPASMGFRHSTLPSMPPPPQHMYRVPSKSRSVNHSPAAQSPLTLAGPSPTSSVSTLGNSNGNGGVSMQMSRSRTNSTSIPASTSDPATGGLVSSNSSIEPFQPLQPTKNGQPRSKLKAVPVDLTDLKARRLFEALWDLTQTENALIGSCKTCGLAGSIAGSFSDALQHSASLHLQAFDAAYAAHVEGQGTSKSS